MKHRIKHVLLAAMMVLGLAAFALPTTTYAIDVTEEACKSNPTATICRTSASNDIGTIINTIINVLLFLVGAIAVVMIIVGGVRFATSAGNADSIKAAKSTVLYAVIGLVISLLAYAIINFVVTLL